MYHSWQHFLMPFLIGTDSSYHQHIIFIFLRMKLNGLKLQRYQEIALPLLVIMAGLFCVTKFFQPPDRQRGEKGEQEMTWGWARHPPLHSVSTGDNQLYGLCNPFHTSRRPLVSASLCLTQSNGRHTVFSVGVKKCWSGECRRENAQFMSHDSSKGQRQLRARVRVRVCLHATLVMPSPVLQHSRLAKRVVEHGHC